MDVVLGLSLTSAAVRWVLVKGTTGEGAPVDRGSLPVEHTLDANALLDQRSAPRPSNTKFTRSASVGPPKPRPGRLP